MAVAKFCGPPVPAFAIWLSCRFWAERAHRNKRKTIAAKEDGAIWTRTFEPSFNFIILIAESDGATEENQ